MPVGGLVLELKCRAEQSSGLVLLRQRLVNLKTHLQASGRAESHEGSLRARWNPEDGRFTAATARAPVMQGSLRRPMVLAEPEEVWRLPEVTSPRLWALIREDWETHGRSLSMPGFQALALHRIATSAAGRGTLVRLVVHALYGVLNRLLIRNVYGLELSRSTVIGRRLRIGHHQGVILGYGATIGDDCLVRQNVTLGQANDEGRPDDQPRVGNGVQFGAGATVIGPVQIGDDARIGPGALVTTDVPARATAFAPPARILKMQSSAAPDTSS